MFVNGLTLKARAWMGLPVAERRYGAGPGTPSPCVQHVRCDHCQAEPGQLCEGDMGPKLGHHHSRWRAYSDAWRSGSAPRQHSPLAAAAEPLEMLARRGCFLWLHTYADGAPFVVLKDDPQAEPGTEAWGGPRHQGSTVLEAIAALVAAMPEAQRSAITKPGAPAVIPVNPVTFTYLLKLVRQQAESGENHEDATYRKHFTCLAILNLARAVEMVAGGAR